MYAHRPDYRQVFEDLSREMANSLDLDHVLQVLLGHLELVTRCERIQVFLEESQRAHTGPAQYVRTASLGEVFGVSKLEITVPSPSRFQIFSGSPSRSSIPFQ